MAYQTYERERIVNPTIEDITKIINEAYHNGLEEISKGQLPTYIPELAKADKNAFGICMLNANGEEVTVGDSDVRFSMQSISKIVILTAALKYLGFRETFSHVLMEPTGDAFNSFIRLDTSNDLPFNPMINAGAIQVSSLLVDKLSFDELLAFAKKLCMDEDISINEAVYNSEINAADRNRSIAFLLNSKNVLQADPIKTVDLYTKMCALNVNAKSLAGLGLILANNGVNPLTKEELISPGYVRTIRSLMFTCGLYDFSGEWGVRVGVPAKSGVGGGITCASKGLMGFGFYGPAVDVHGNSVASIKAMEHISHMLRLHVFDY